MLVSFVSTLATKLDLITNPALHPSVDPKFVLNGNYAPVGEMPPTDCLVVEGELPPSLNGVYIHNGPNPQHQPLGPHHLFEGDGMLHSISLSQGHATYCSRYVKTYKYKLEHEAGFSMIPNFLSGFYGPWSRIYCPKKGYDGITQEGDIETIGRHDFEGKAPVNMTAHPNIDYETGEVFAYQCFPVFPYLRYFRFDANGNKQKDVPIFSSHSPTYVHDIGITKQYAIFPDTVLEMDPLNMIMLQGMPVRCRASKVPRIGIIKRYATSGSEMRWFKVSGFNAFHMINAWEDGQSGIIIVATNPLNIKNIFHDLGKVNFSLEKVRIDMKTGEITRSVLSKRSLEMGSTNPSYSGKKNRYVYMGTVVCEQVPKISGVVKIDLELGCEVAFRSYGDDCFGGEVLFVGRDAGNQIECAEDDGFLVSFVHNERKNESQFVVMDAKSPTLEIVAIVKLPGRVPYGFHGIFLGKKELQMM